MDLIQHADSPRYILLNELAPDVDAGLAGPALVDLADVDLVIDVEVFE